MLLFSFSIVPDCASLHENCQDVDPTYPGYFVFTARKSACSKEEQALLFFNRCPGHTTQLRLIHDCGFGQSRLSHIRRSHIVRDVCPPDYLEYIFRRREGRLVTPLSWSSGRKIRT